MNAAPWPRGLSQAQRHAHLIGTTHGEMLAPLVARIAAAQSAKASEPPAQHGLFGEAA